MTKMHLMKFFNFSLKRVEFVVIYHMKLRLNSKCTSLLIEKITTYDASL